MANPPKNERMFDLRVVDRYIGSGRLERGEYTAHLETLDDVAENVRPREEGGDEDGYDRPIVAANEPRRVPLSALFVRSRVETDDDDDDDDDFDDDEDEDEDDDAADADGATEAPADAPTDAPTEAPTEAPTDAPTEGDAGPTNED